MTNKMMDYSLLLMGEAGEGVDGWVRLGFVCCVAVKTGQCRTSGAGMVLKGTAGAG
jgi:hypothetical protein